MDGFCLLVELPREGSVPAACAAGLFNIFDNIICFDNCGIFVDPSYFTKPFLNLFVVYYAMRRRSYSFQQWAQQALGLYVCYLI